MQQQVGIVEWQHRIRWMLGRLITFVLIVLLLKSKSSAHEQNKDQRTARARILRHCVYALIQGVNA